MRLHLWHKLSLLFAAVLVALTAILVLAVARPVAGDLRSAIEGEGNDILARQAENYLMSLVREQTRRIDAELRHASATAGFAGLLLGEMSGAYDLNPDFMQSDLSFLYHHSGGHAVYAVAKSGELWRHPSSSARPDSAAKFAATRAEISRLPAGLPSDKGAVLWGPVYLNPFSPQYDLVVDAISPVFRNGQHWGHVGVTISVTDLIAEFQRRAIIPGSYTFIVDSSSRLIGAPPQGRVELVAPQAFRPRGPINLLNTGSRDLDAAIKEMTLGASAVRTVSIKGDKKYLAFRPLHAIDWRLGLTVQVSMATAISAQLIEAVDLASSRVLPGAITSIALLLVATLACSILLSRRLVAPLRQMTAVSERIAKGHFDQRVAVTSNDEMGRLGHHFNTMAQRISELIADLKRRADELREANDSLKQQTEILQSVLYSMGEGVVVADEKGDFILWNAEAERLVGIGVEEGEHIAMEEWATHFGAFLPDTRTPFPMQDLPMVQALHGKSVDQLEMFMRNPNIPEGNWLSVNARPLPGGDGKLRGAVSVFRDITQTKHFVSALEQAQSDLERRVDERTAELREAQCQLVEAAHQAGRAEVANSVLHNVGNVLNSVNVSATLVSNRLRSSRISKLQRLAELVYSHDSDLASFLVEDETGRQLPHYLSKLAEHLENERIKVIEELDSMNRNINHIRHIVTLQQDYAGQSNMVENVAASDVVEDALRIESASLKRHNIRVTRAFTSTPEIRIDRHKLLQILVNLMSNAKYALLAADREDKEIRIHIDDVQSDLVRIEVSDNGIGISKENLEKLFRHRFTTRKDGHGIGLHGSAIAAEEIGVRLRAHSDGLDCGATFTVEIPMPKLNKPHEVG
ncbi:MAG: HAMP domain-containing protein [Proteobacteria bacterium]|nr:HAMP domain-containing protein [Pseudomonadota bacterium]